MTDFHVDVVRLGPVENLPNSDTLAITLVHGGYPCIIKRGSFKEGDLAVYIPVDTVLPDIPMFSFLAASDRKRLKAKRLRGTFSMGLLVPMPDLRVTPPLKEGDDVAALLGITKYEPTERHIPGHPKPQDYNADTEKGPSTFIKYTDIEPYRRHPHTLREGESVVLTEKIHGMNYRFMHDGKRLWVGSHRQVRERLEPKPLPWWQRALRFLGMTERYPLPKPPMQQVWWQIAQQYDLERKLAEKQYRNLVFFGEVYGAKIQDLEYGEAVPRLRIFDIYDAQAARYLDHDAVKNHTTILELDMVPVLHEGPWNKELLKLCEGQTRLNGARHTIEGFVAKPMFERTDPRLGRVILKMVGEGYLLRKGG